MVYYQRLTECTVLSFASPIQLNNYFCLPGKISSNVFTIAGTKLQCHNRGTYYQLGPTGGSVTIHKSLTGFYSGQKAL